MRHVRLLAAGLFAGATALSQASTDPVVATSTATLALRYELTDLDLTDQIQPAVQFTDSLITSTLGYRSADGPLQSASSVRFGETLLERAAGHARTTTSPTTLLSETVFDSADPKAHWFSAENKLSLHFLLTPSTEIRLIGAVSYSPDPMLARVQSPRYAEVLGFIYGPESFANGQGGGGGESGELISTLYTGAVAAPGMVNLQTLAQLEVGVVPEPAAFAMLLPGLLLVAIARGRRACASRCAPSA